MKITRHTPEQLVAEENPVGLGIGLLLAALGFAWLGFDLWTGDEQATAVFVWVFGGGAMIGSIWFLVARAQLILDRTTGQAEIRHRRGNRTTRVWFDLTDVDKATVDTHTSSGKHRQTVAMVYLEVTGGMDAGRHAVTATAGEPTQHAALARAINSWLSQQRT